MKKLHKQNRAKITEIELLMIKQMKDFTEYIIRIIEEK
jgi:hypothetical protein